jgi:rhomboid protease GluP
VESRPICPGCRAFISRADRVCPYCDFELAPAAKTRSDVARSLGALLPENGQVTTYIIVVNLFLYLATGLFSTQNTRGGSFFNIDGMTLFLFGAKDASYIFRGEWWRLITAGFLHGGILHIFMNSMGLHQLGELIDELVGPGKLIVIYVASTITGFLLSSYWSPALSIGASAGVFGLIGAAVGAGANERGSFGRDIKAYFARFAIFAFFSSFLIGQTDHAAHLGGLIGGGVVAYVITLPAFKRPQQQRYWNIAGLAAAGLVVVCFVIQLLNTLRFLRS